MLLRCRFAQARRVGRGHVDGEIVGERRQHRHALDVIADVVLGVAVLADIGADDAAAAAARAASRAATAGSPSLLKPKRLIRRLVLAQAEKARRRVAGLRPRRDRARLRRNRSRSRASASGTSAFLSKPAASPTGLGKVRRHSLTARRGGSGPARCGENPAASARMRQSVRRFRRQRTQERQGKIEQRGHRPKTLPQATRARQGPRMSRLAFRVRCGRPGASDAHSAATRSSADWRR